PMATATAPSLPPPPAASEALPAAGPAGPAAAPEPPTAPATAPGAGQEAQEQPRAGTPSRMVPRLTGGVPPPRDRRHPDPGGPPRRGTDDTDTRARPWVGGQESGIRGQKELSFLTPDP